MLTQEVTKVRTALFGTLWESGSVLHMSIQRNHNLQSFTKYLKQTLVFM